MTIAIISLCIIFFKTTSIRDWRLFTQTWKEDIQGILKLVLWSEMSCSCDIVGAAFGFSAFIYHMLSVRSKRLGIIGLCEIWSTGDCIRMNLHFQRMNVEKIRYKLFELCVGFDWVAGKESSKQYSTEQNRLKSLQSCNLHQGTGEAIFAHYY